MIGKFCVRKSFRWLGCWIARMGLHVRLVISVGIVLGVLWFPVSAQALLSFVEVQQDGVGGVDGLDGAYSVTVSPDGKNLYAAGGSDDAVAVFSRNATTGELSFVEVQKDGVGGVDGLYYARSVTVSPDGKNLYAAGAIDDAVAVFGIDLPGNAMPWIPLLLLED